MMSIGAMPAMPPGGSPRDQVVSSLDEQVEAGEITAEDQDAMLEALDAMHEKRMEADRPDFGSGPPSKEEMQANFQSMLSDQVESGSLTQDQADHLMEMFEEGELGGPPPGGPGGPSVSGQEEGDMMAELMNSILEQMQSGTAYGETGSQSASAVESLLADFIA